MNAFREWLSDNLRYILLGLFIILALAAILLGIKFASSKLQPDEDAQTTVSQQDAGIDKTVDTEVSGTPAATAEPTEDPVQTVKNAEVEALVKEYYTALGNKDIAGIKAVVDNLAPTEEARITKEQYLESYSNITSYIKEGLKENSYIVFASYQYKFKDIDTPVPGLSQLYVCTKADGRLYISNEEQDAQTQQRITEVLQSADVQKLIADVQSNYEAALESDEKLKTFISSQGIATSHAAEAEAGASIQAKSSCNVRAEASEDAEIIGQLEENQQVVKKGAVDDWIQIEYDGETGYVRSDMFQ